MDSWMFDILQLVEYFVNRYTKPGDTVLDPFLGFGTTLRVANRLGREGWGIEISDKKITYLKKELGIDKGLIHGDVNRLFLDRVLPEIDFVMTSPPYMNKYDTANALSGSRYSGTYEGYLEQIGDIFEKIRDILTKKAVIVIEISNLKHDKQVTTVVLDIQKLRVVPFLDKSIVP